MQKRSLILLASATVILVALAIFALAFGDRGVSRAAPGERAFPALAAKLDDIASMRSLAQRIDLDLHPRRRQLARLREGQLSSKRRQNQAARIGDGGFTLIEPKTRQPDLYPRLQVEDPEGENRPRFRSRTNRAPSLRRLIVGKRRYDRLGAGNDGVYLRKPGDPQAWLAGGSLDPSGEPSAWLDRRILDIAEKKIAKVSLTQADSTRLVDQPFGAGCQIRRRGRARRYEIQERDHDQRACHSARDARP